MSARMAATIFAFITGLVIAFQFALAAGAPWGSYAMGGAYPGVFPPPMRVAAIVQALILALAVCIVLARAGVALPRWGGWVRRGAWAVVAFAAVSLVMNLATPSAGERALWAPVAALMLASSLRVALARQA